MIVIGCKTSLFDVISHSYKYFSIINPMETNYRPKNTFKLQLKKEGQQITVSSDFDSGNMAAA